MKIYLNSRHVGTIENTAFAETFMNKIFNIMQDFCNFLNAWHLNDWRKATLAVWLDYNYPEFKAQMNIIEECLHFYLTSDIRRN